MDQSACTECARCTNYCPAYTAFDIDRDGGHAAFVRIPDRFCNTSSIMMQKKNVIGPAEVKGDSQGRGNSGVYLRGLLQDGERKSIEPMVARVPRPPELLDIQDPQQALQQFVNQSPWDEQKVWKRYRRVMAGPLASPRGIFVIDDTGFPKQGRHSVGVQRQYCGQLGKLANCVRQESLGRGKAM